MGSQKPEQQSLLCVHAPFSGTHMELELELAPPAPPLPVALVVVLVVLLPDALVVLAPPVPADAVVEPVPALVVSEPVLAVVVVLGPVVASDELAAPPVGAPIAFELLLPQATALATSPTPRIQAH